jgi:hypothetical protein
VHERSFFVLKNLVYGFCDWDYIFGIHVGEVESVVLDCRGWLHAVVLVQHGHHALDAAAHQVVGSAGGSLVRHKQPGKNLNESSIHL